MFPTFVPRRGEPVTDAKLSSLREHLTTAPGQWLTADTTPQLAQFAFLLARIRRRELRDELSAPQRHGGDGMTCALAYLVEVWAAVIRALHAEVSAPSAVSGSPLQRVFPVIAASVTSLHDWRLARAAVPTLAALVVRLHSVAVPPDAATKTQECVDAEVDLQRELVRPVVDPTDLICACFYCLRCWAFDVSA